MGKTCSFKYETKMVLPFSRWLCYQKCFSFNGNQLGIYLFLECLRTPSVSLVISRCRRKLTFEGTSLALSLKDCQCKCLRNLFYDSVCLSFNGFICVLHSFLQPTVRLPTFVGTQIDMPIFTRKWNAVRFYLNLFC